MNKIEKKDLIRSILYKLKWYRGVSGFLIFACALLLFNFWEHSWLILIIGVILYLEIVHYYWKKIGKKYGDERIEGFVDIEIYELDKMILDYEKNRMFDEYLKKDDKGGAPD